MKYILTAIIFITSYSTAHTQDKCEGVLAKLKSECNIVGKSMKKMKDFSKENKTIDQTLGISKTKDGKKKSLKEFSKENKTIDQTYKNIKEKLKKKDGN
jgi:hypothetical protein